LFLSGNSKITAPFLPIVAKNEAPLIIIGTYLNAFLSRRIHTIAGVTVDKKHYQKQKKIRIKIRATFS